MFSISKEFFFNHLIKYVHKNFMDIAFEVHQFNLSDITGIAANCPVDNCRNHEVSTEWRWETIHSCWDWWHSNWCSVQILGRIQDIVDTLFELQDHKLFLRCVLDKVRSYSMADIFSIRHFSSICHGTATNRYSLKGFNPLLRAHNHFFSTHFCINLCQASIEEQLTVCSVYQNISLLFYNISSSNF